MSRIMRFVVSLDRGPSVARYLGTILLMMSICFVSSADALSFSPNSGGLCTPVDLRRALNHSWHSFATCDATTAPSDSLTKAPRVPTSTVEREDGKVHDALPVPSGSESKSSSESLPVDAAPSKPPSASTTAAPAVDVQQHPPIASYDEWTKQKLQQPPPPVVQPSTSTTPDGPQPIAGGGTAPANGGPADPVLPGSPPRTITAPEAAAHAATVTRNYASRECGAKVIFQNPEAENTKAVLNDKEKDDYMRNPCDKAQNKHIVIELCETIQPRSIEIANFELFSSGPASVRFSAAERFPTQQWNVLGEWSLADTRVVQTLPVPMDKLTYAKFIKLELLAHHGSEHYCTLSTVRVLGVSMVDEYEAEAAVAARIAAPHAAVAAPEAPVLATPQNPPKDEQAVKKEESIPITSPSDTPNVSTSTEVPPIAVVEAPPVVPKAVPESAPTEPETKVPGTGIVQDVMSGSLLKKIIEVVGGRKKEQEDKAPRARQSRAHAAYAACDQTPVGGWPRATCARRNFFCPRITPATHNNTTIMDAPPQVKTAAEAAAKRAAARRAFIAATQRREEQQKLPPPQVDASPQQRKATAPVVQSIPETAAPKEEPTPPTAAKPLQQLQPPIAAPPTQQAPPPPVTNGEGYLAAGTSSHKESVFMKLNKRIAALELNMSLSTEYLSELSRQYIAQTDEQKKAMERTRLAAERAAVDVARTVNETMRDELFNLRKEVDALSAWLASLRHQAGSVALARRISGTHAAAPETSPAPERSSSAEVGHRRMRMEEMEEEDYVTYEESYERSCPNSDGTGRSYGPLPRPAREDDARDADGEEEEGQADADSSIFDLHHFRHHSDGIWTTEQVLYAVLGAQALTVVLVLVMQMCYARVFDRRRPSTPLHQQIVTTTAPAATVIDTAELERLIAVALERRAVREATAAPAPLDVAVEADASPRSSASSVASSSTSASQLPTQQQQQPTGSKKKRRQRRSIAEQQQQQHQHQDHQCRLCGGERDFDSAMDSSLPSPSQTGSEEEFETAPRPAAHSSPNMT